MGASFEERSVWVQLGSMVIALGAYFVLAGRLLIAGEREMSAFAGLFIVAVGVLVVLLIAGHALAAIGPKPEARDERDRIIAWRSEYRSSWIVAVGVMGAIAALAAGWASVLVANLLLVSLALSAVVGFVLRIAAYRRGV